VFKERRRHDNQYNNDDGFDENFIALAPDEAGIYSFDEMFSPQVLIELTNKTLPGGDQSTGKISYHIVYDGDEEEAAGSRKGGGAKTPTSTSTRQSVVLNDDGTQDDYDVLMDDGDGDYYPDGNEKKLKSSYNSINQDGYDGENDGNLGE
jgi:hypothetical protein